MALTTNWDIEHNYWELNPMVKAIAIFRDFEKQDKSKKKFKSSKVMWAIAMLVDTDERNPYNNVLATIRPKMIAEDFLEDPAFEWEDDFVIALKDAYTDLVMSSNKKELYRLEKKLSERGDFIDRTPYTMDSYSDDGKRELKGTASQLDKMMKDSLAIFKQIEDIKELIAIEDAASQLVGGAQESASDKKLI